jgi:hypothetical protein
MNRREIVGLALHLAVGLVLVGAAEARRPTGPPIVPATTVLAAPLSPSVVSISWPAFGANTTQYVIYRNGKGIGAVASTADQNFVDTNRVASTSYTYDVYADNGKNVFTWGGQAQATTLSASPILSVATFEEGVTNGTARIGGWGKIATDKSRISVSTEQARAGTKSVKFDFRFADWGNTANQNRTQIGQGDAPGAPVVTLTTLGQDYWAGFSTFLDPSWVPDNDTNQELIWQYHGNSLSPGAWTPPLSYSTLGTTGYLQVKGHASNVYTCSDFSGSAPPNAAVYTETYTGDIGKWVDWVVHVNFNYAGGKAEVWKNGVKVMSFTGATIYHCDNETGQGGPYFGSVGPYKWDWGNLPTLVSTRVMFMDEIRIGNSTATCDDVKPTGSAACAP